MPTISFPSSPFKLHQPFPPAGDQPAAIDKLFEGINDGLAYQTLLGATGFGKTYTIAVICPCAFSLGDSRDNLTALQ